MTDPFARFGVFALRNRRRVLAWLVVVGVCDAFAPEAADLLEAAESQDELR